MLESFGDAETHASGGWGLIYLVLTCVFWRMTIFEKKAAYKALEQILEVAVQRTGTDLLGCCLVPNNWHLVAKPPTAGALSRSVS